MQNLLLFISFFAIQCVDDFIYFIADSPQRPLHLFESRNKAITSPKAATPYQIGVPTPNIYINQRTMLPLTRYQHSNRLRKRPRRSSKSSPNKQSYSVSNQLITASSWSNSAVRSSLVYDKPSQPSFVPSLPSSSASSSPSSSSSSSLLLLSFSPMLSSSILAAKMKPPYVSSPSSLHSSQVSANRIEMQTNAGQKNITAQIGHPVHLHCIVESLGDKMV